MLTDTEDYSNVQVLCLFFTSCKIKHCVKIFDVARMCINFFKMDLTVNVWHSSRGNRCVRSFAVSENMIAQIRNLSLFVHVILVSILYQSTTEMKLTQESELQIGGLSNVLLNYVSFCLQVAAVMWAKMQCVHIGLSTIVHLFLFLLLFFLEP